LSAFFVIGLAHHASIDIRPHRAEHAAHHRERHFGHEPARFADRGLRQLELPESGPSQLALAVWGVRDVHSIETVVAGGDGLQEVVGDKATALN
jgi:hypothetical protein